MPSTVPIEAPMTEITTDSQRTIARTWLRVMPTARSRPSSRVRSKADSASVLTMPRSAMSTASKQHDGDEPEQLVDGGAFGLLKPLLIEHVRIRMRGEDLRDPVLHLLRVRSGCHLDERGGVQQCGFPLLVGLQRDEVVIVEVGLLAVDALDAQVLLSSPGEFDRNEVADPPVVGGRGLGHHHTVHGEVAGVARGHAEVDDLLHGGRVQGGERRYAAIELGLAVTGLGHQ